MPCHAGEDALVAGLTGQPGTWPTPAACLPPMETTRYGPPTWCLRQLALEGHHRAQ